MFRLFAAAVVVGGLLSWSSPVAAATIDADGVPIVWVDLDGPNGPVSQGAPVSGVVDQSHTPVPVATVTVDDGGLKALQPRSVSVSVGNLNYPADLTGVRASENGARTPSSSPDFAAAAARIFSSPDLRDYISSDDLSRPDGDWGADYDISFAQPLGTDGYLLIHERNGNASVKLQALGASGEPIAAAPVAVLRAGSGWNTGFAPADLSRPQPVHLTVLDIDRLLEGTGTSVLHGIRVDNDDEADINITPLVDASGAASVEAPSSPEPAAPSLPVASTGIGFTKSVYRGADGGAGCNTATTFVEAGPTETVTYCFIVTNTGAAHLDAITVTDAQVAGPVLALSADSDPLAPGHVARFYVESVPPPDEADGAVDDTFVNRASVSAVPVDGGSIPVPDSEPLRASAEALVFAPEDIPTPALELSKSVYAGVDGGKGCPAADLTLVQTGDSITYCYTVTNVGNTHLDSITLDPFDIEGDPVLLWADSSPLAPGQSAYYHLDAVAPKLPAEGVVMTSAATANSVDGAGADLSGLGDVSDTDGTEIKTPPVSPAAPAAPAQATTQNEAPAGLTGIEAPQQLAFTGWETWLIVAIGVGLIAGGWALLQETSFRRRTLPVRRRQGDVDG